MYLLLLISFTNFRHSHSPTDACLIHSKSFHCSLHPVKARTLPNKVNTQPMGHINWNSLKDRNIENEPRTKICDVTSVLVEGKDDKKENRKS